MPERGSKNSGKSISERERETESGRERERDTCSCSLPTTDALKTSDVSASASEFENSINLSELVYAEKVTVYFILSTVIDSHLPCANVARVVRSSPTSNSVRFEFQATNNALWLLAINEIKKQRKWRIITEQNKIQIQLFAFTRHLQTNAPTNMIARRDEHKTLYGKVSSVNNWHYE